MSDILYRISRKALQDIGDIWLYTKSNWSIEQADRYYRLIMDEIEYLSQNDESGKPADHIKTGYRSSQVKSHIIFYKRDKNGNINIIRILHKKMDIPNRLK